MSERATQRGCFALILTTIAVVVLVTIAGILGEIRDVLKAGCQ